jgi:hypothetical protein
MARPTITLRVTRSWWVMPYLHTLALLCAITGREPDMEKVTRTLMRGVHVRRA